MGCPVGKGAAAGHPEPWKGRQSSLVKLAEADTRYDRHRKPKDRSVQILGV